MHRSGTIILVFYTYSMLNRIKDSLRWFRFAGTTYCCPLCKKHARVFPSALPGPGQSIIDQYRIVSMGARPHYRCPWCNSSDKERMVWMYLKRVLRIEEHPTRILH